MRVLGQIAASLGRGLALYQSAESRVDHWHVARFHGLESPHLSQSGSLPGWKLSLIRDGTKYFNTAHNGALSWQEEAKTIS